MCGKKNPLWETDVQPFTRSVPFWQGRTVVRGSHLEACFFIVSWNFPVTQLWEQVGDQRASGPSMNQTRVRGCLCGGQCVSVWFFDVGYVKTFEIQHCDSSGEHICPKMEEEKGPGW